MRKRDFKGKVVKKRALKAATVCRCYDDLQLAALDVFEADQAYYPYTLFHTILL